MRTGRSLLRFGSICCSISARHRWPGVVSDMEKIKRYSIEGGDRGDYSCCEHDGKWEDCTDDPDWCKSSDVAALEARCAELENDNGLLRLTLEHECKSRKGADEYISRSETKIFALETSTTEANANAGMWHGVAVRKAEELDESDTLRIGAEYTNEIYEKRIAELEKRLEDAEKLAEHIEGLRDEFYEDGATPGEVELLSIATSILSRTGKEEKS